MKKLAIYCVTYNSYRETEFFLKSVNSASQNADGLDVTVIVADNTEINQENISTDYSNINVKIYKTGHNCGYLGAAQASMKQYSPEKYDFIAISNVDLEISPESLNRLVSVNIDENVGWIAPQIYSTLEKRDRNPKILERYSKKKISILLFLYNHPWANNLYEATLYKRKKVAIVRHSEGETIYAGHGSFMIFTKAYIQKAGIPQYPIFLFGEEIYFAEQCQNAGLKTVYMPSIKIIDSEHCSTSNMHSKAYFKYNADSLKYILNEFYK